MRHGGIYVISSISSQAVMLLAWIVLPWKLTPAEIGQFALASFGTDMLARFITLGTDSAIVRFYVEEKRRPLILRSAWAWLAVGLAAAVPIVWLSRGIVPRLIEGLSSSYSQLMWLMLATGSATALASTIFAHHVASGDAAQFGRLSVLKSAMIASGFLITASLGLGVTGLLATQMLAALMVVAVFLRTGNRLERNSSFNRDTMREMAAYGFPMTAYAAFAIVSDYIGRLVLGRDGSLAELGVYQFYFQIALQVNGLWASVNRAWTPFLFQRMNIDEPNAYHLVRFAIVSVSTLYGVALVLCQAVGESGVLRWILPPAYADRIDLLYILLLGPLFGCIYTAMTPLFYFGRDTIRVSITQCVIAATTMTVSVYLTLSFGAAGAAAGWVAGIFLAPVVYMVAFPRIFAELRTVAYVLGIWGLGTIVVTWAQVQPRSELLAVSAVLACVLAVGTFARRDWHVLPTVAS